MSSLPPVAVVLLNYNGVEDTLACLTSLQTLDYPTFKIWVVDNASSGDDVARLRESGFDIQVIASPTNTGFSGGCNLGIQAALEDTEISYVWLLNNDTTVEPNTLRALVKTAQTEPNSLVGSVIFHPDGRFQRVGNHVNLCSGKLREYSWDTIQQQPEVQCLSGCSMLLSRDILDRLGLWDEGYFLYFEDNDYCLRARKVGIPSVVSLESRIFHKEGASTGKNRPLVTYYYQRNRLLLAQKHFSPLCRIWLGLYTRFRLFRSTIKTSGSPDPEKQRHHRAFCLAVSDFNRGVEGPCPHPI